VHTADKSALPEMEISWRI